MQIAWRCFAFLWIDYIIGSSSGDIWRIYIRLCVQSITRTRAGLFIVILMLNKKLFHCSLATTLVRIKLIFI